MSSGEFYHDALVRRIRDRDDCDDDLRGACDEIEDCYESIERLEAEIARLRLTDAEREAVEYAAYACEKWYEHSAAATLRGLLARTGGT